MLKMIEKLKGLQAKKDIIKNQLNGIESYYFRKGRISIDNSTNDYNFDRDLGNKFVFNKDLFIIYLESEYKQVNQEIEVLLKEITDKQLTD